MRALIAVLLSLLVAAVSCAQPLDQAATSELAILNVQGQLLECRAQLTIERSARRQGVPIDATYDQRAGAFVTTTTTTTTLPREATD